MNESITEEAIRQSFRERMSRLYDTVRESTGKLALAAALITGSATAMIVAEGSPAEAEASSEKSSEGDGYWMVTSNGNVYEFGDAQWYGSGFSETVDIEPTPGGNGYWLADKYGFVGAYGDAPFLGSDPHLQYDKKEVATSISSTPTGRGYWMYTNLGRVVTYGDAQHFGDMSGTRLNGEILDSVPTPSGQGYYMVGSDGGVFTFGDAEFEGSTGDMKLNAPVQSLVPDPDGQGYWLFASDGGVFSFGAIFRGSTGDSRLNRPMTGGIAYGDGYLLVAEDGGIFNFSNKPFRGSLGDNPPVYPVVSVAAYAPKG